MRIETIGSQSQIKQFKIINTVPLIVLSGILIIMLFLFIDSFFLNSQFIKINPMFVYIPPIIIPFLILIIIIILRFQRELYNDLFSNNLFKKNLVKGILPKLLLITINRHGGVNDIVFRFDPGLFFLPIKVIINIDDYRKIKPHIGMKYRINTRGIFIINKKGKKFNYDEDMKYLIIFLNLVFEKHYQEIEKVLKG